MSYTISPSAFAVAISLAVVPAAQAQQPASDSTRAVDAALTWLVLVDSAQWQASVESASDLFREITGSPANWQQFVTMARSRYPVSGERRLVAWDPTFAPEGAPEGRFSRAAFQSTGAHASIESVVLILTPTGWRVAMYGIGGG